MKSYIVTCTYTSDGGGTAQQYMIGEDYEEGDEYIYWPN